MAYFLSVTKAKPKPLIESAANPLLQRLTLRCLQGITVVFLLGTICGFLLLWQPAYLQWRSLQRDENYWQEVLRTGITNTKNTINNRLRAGAKTSLLSALTATKKDDSPGCPLGRKA